VISSRVPAHELPPRIDIHTRIRTFMKLERLKKANGTTADEVNWLAPRGTAPGVNLARLALLGHDEWLENILADASAERWCEPSSSPSAREEKKA
jgi:hypothetical protein